MNPLATSTFVLTAAFSVVVESNPFAEVAVVVQQGAVVAVGFAVAAADSRRGQTLAIWSTNAFGASVLNLTNFVLSTIDTVTRF